MVSERIHKAEALDLFGMDLLELGRRADAARRRIVGSERVGFVIDRNITFTNYCDVGCNFCAFYCRGDEEGYELSIAEILEKVEELVKLGGTQVLLQGGIRKNRGLGYYTGMLSAVKQRFPGIHLHSLSPSEVHCLSVREGLRVRDVLSALIEAGLDSLPGAAEILVDAVRRRVSPKKPMTRDWLHVMRTCHELGIHTTATMTFGMGESIEDRIEHFEHVRRLQDETGGFKAFIPWTFSPRHTRMSEIPGSLANDYLRTLALSRIYLDNFPHITSGWVTEGLDLAQVGLFFGADDFGGILMEEVVLRSAGVSFKAGVDDFVHLIREAGKIPVQRNSKYEALRVYP